MLRRSSLLALLFVALVAALPNGAAAAGSGGSGKAQLQARVGWGPLSDAQAARREQA